MPKLVEQVFADADCSQGVGELGRGRYYERLLLDRNAAEPQRLNASTPRGSAMRSGGCGAPST
jgi:hypothetical protein